MDLRALAVAAAVGAMVLSGCTAVGQPRADSRTPVPVGLATGCPEPVTDIRFPEGDLPEGATQVRLCPGPPLTDYNGDPLGDEIQAPVDLVTSAVSDLVRLVNEQQHVDDDIECTFDEGPVLAYWFGYPDGDWRAVQYGAHGCHLLTTGEDQRRRGGAELATAFTEALADQREGGEVPGVARQAECPASPLATPHSGLVLEEVEIATAAWCVNPRAQLVREVAIPPELVELPNTDLWPGLPIKSRRPCGEAFPSWIEAVTPWGDAVSYAISSCGEIYRLHGATLLDDGARHYLTPDLDAALMTLPLGPMVDHRG